MVLKWDEVELVLTRFLRSLRASWAIAVQRTQREESFKPREGPGLQVKERNKIMERTNFGLLLAKIESSYGADPTPVATANTIGLACCQDFAYTH